MRIFVLSDIHGSEDALEKLRARKGGDFDYAMVAGDCTGNSTSFMLELLEILPDAYVVPGNNENANVMEILKKAKHYAHEKRLELKDGHNLVGFGLSNPTPFSTPGEMKDEEIHERLGKMKIDEKTILLAHAPAYGLLDVVNGQHIGSRAIRRIIEEKQPFLVFCGHLHEVIGVGKLGKTIIVNVPAAKEGWCAVAEIKERNILVEFRKL